jgi:hypothetical protein
MKDKYYTPKLEEFHIGFEYEWRNSEDDSWKKENSPTEITAKGYNDQIDGLRVKYLDKEDVESAGFREEKNNIFKFKDKYKRKWQLNLLMPDRGRILLSNDCKYFMDIDIKNKSEFKVILKQLNINE